MNAMSEISGEAKASPYTAITTPAASGAPLGTPGEFRTSPTIGALAVALAKAQGEFPAINKDRTVQVKSDKGSYKFSYATLDEITDKTRPALLKNGLVCVQMLAHLGVRPVLVTRLLHESGEWLEGTAPLAADGKNPQQFGSAITYVRRYALSAMLGVTAEEDDDGNAAVGNHVQPVQRRQNAAGPARQQERPRDDEANPWIVASRDGVVKELADARAWVAEWKLRLGAVEKAKNGGPADKRRTISAMFEANAGVFARLHDLGHEATVREVARLQDALMVRLDEREHAR